MEIQKNYSLKDFQNIIFNGFQFELPESTLKLVNEISNEVGSPTYIKTPVFQKREQPIKMSTSKEELAKILMGYSNDHSFHNNHNSNANSNHKKRRGKNVEAVNDEDWETIRTFHTTKMEQKTGVDAQYDVIRSNLNKLTDKNMEEMSSRIVNVIEELKREQSLSEILSVVYHQIFENAFNNRFYSKIYVLLYSKIIHLYDSPSLNHKEKLVIDLLNKINESILSIEYVEPSVNYDKFCKINKENERRRAMCDFLVHLMKQKMIELDVCVKLLGQLFDILFGWMLMENKKNEIDELSELIFILWKKDLYESLDISEDFLKKIELVATSKVKDYLSLTNKTIFKFMDMLEM